MSSSAKRIKPTPAEAGDRLAFDNWLAASVHASPTIVPALERMFIAKLPKSSTFRDDQGHELTRLMLQALMVNAPEIPATFEDHLPLTCHRAPEGVWETAQALLLRYEDYNPTFQALCDVLVVCRAFRAGKAVALAGAPDLVCASRELIAMTPELLHKVFDPTKWKKVTPKLLNGRLERFLMSGSSMESAQLEWSEAALVRATGPSPAEQATRVQAVLAGHRQSRFWDAYCAHSVELWPHMQTLLPLNLVGFAAVCKELICLNLPARRRDVTQTMLPWSRATVDSFCAALPFQLQPLDVQLAAGRVAVFDSKISSEAWHRVAHGLRGETWRGSDVLGYLRGVHQLSQEPHHEIRGEAGDGPALLRLYVLSGNPDDVEPILAHFMTRTTEATPKVVAVLLEAINLKVPPQMDKLREAAGYPRYPHCGLDDLVRRLLTDQPLLRLDMAASGIGCSTSAQAHEMAVNGTLDRHSLQGLLHPLCDARADPHAVAGTPAERTRAAEALRQLLATDRTELGARPTLASDVLALVAPFFNGRHVRADIQPSQALIAVLCGGDAQRELMRELLATQLTAMGPTIDGCGEAGAWTASFVDGRMRTDAVELARRGNARLESMVVRTPASLWQDAMRAYLQLGDCDRVQYSRTFDSSDAGDADVLRWAEYIRAALKERYTLSLVVGVSPTACSMVRATMDHAGAIRLHAQFAPDYTYRSTDPGHFMCSLVFDDLNNEVTVHTSPTRLPGKRSEADCPVEVARCLLRSMDVTAELADRDWGDVQGALASCRDAVGCLVSAHPHYRHQLESMATLLGVLLDFAGSLLPSECLRFFVGIATTQHFGQRWPHDGVVRRVAGDQYFAGAQRVIVGGLALYASPASVLIALSEDADGDALSVAAAVPDATHLTEPALRLLASVQATRDLYAEACAIHAQVPRAVVREAYRLAEQLELDESTQQHLTWLLVVCRSPQMPSREHSFFRSTLYKGMRLLPVDIAPMLRQLISESAAPVKECHRCGKPLMRPTKDGYGPTCSGIVAKRLRDE
jgi:hypothetical protein